MDFNHGFCPKTLRSLDDSFLFDKYKQSVSVRRRMEQLSACLQKNTHLSVKKCGQLANIITLENMIPSGVKASVRGRVFNELVAKRLRRHTYKNLIIKTESFPESMKNQKQLHEIPDWYIENIKTGEKIVGYNQIDLWSGGAQCNRAHKYLANYKLYQTLKKKHNCTLVCIIASRIPSKNSSKNFKVLQSAIKENRLFYIRHVDDLLKSMAHVR